VFRRSAWLDTRTNTPQYGIEANIGNGWKDCCADGKAVLFSTEWERDVKLTELQKRYKCARPNRQAEGRGSDEGKRA
jgi:hypothetical protein